MHNMELHPSGPEYMDMLTQQDLPPLEMTGQYRSTGVATVSKLPSSTEEVLLRANQCWLIPELVDGNRVPPVVFEVLGFTAAGEDEKQANVLIWTRPGSAPLSEGKVRTERSSLSDFHRGTATGLNREVVNFDG